VIAGLKPYARTKPSEAAWLDDVPADWAIVPMLVAFRPRSVKNVGLVETQVLSLSYGRIVVKPAEKLHGLVPESFEGYQIVEPGNIIIRATDLQNDRRSLRVGLVRDRGIITSAYMCVETNDCIAPEFGYLLLHAYDLKKVLYGYGSGLRQNLDFRHIKRMPVVVPSPAAQGMIVKFLGHADQRIGAYVAAKQRLVSLLDEQRKAIIDHAVTRGVAGSGELQTLATQPPEHVPTHWDVRPLKRWVSTKITDGPHETPTLLDEGIDFVSAEAMVDGRIDFERRRGRIAPEVHEMYCRKCRPRRRDIFMCKSGATTGKLAIVDTDQEFSVWSPLALIRVDSHSVLPELLMLVLQSTYVQRQVQATWSYGTQPNLSMAAMERLIVAMPEIDEQRALLAHVTSELAPIEAAITHAHREMALIRDYRARLIADVMTGQLDVSDAAASLPDVDAPIGNSVGPDLGDEEAFGEEVAA
jgi:type I restriction enzyme, S subunit